MMKSPHLSLFASSLLATTTIATTSPSINSTFYNPVLPGWHSDPSCVHVNSTFFCATSTFLVFPGLPIYASTDLLHWHLASHAWTRPDQFEAPNAGRNGTDYQQAGFFAPNLRFHDGVFYLTNIYISDGLSGTVFKTTNPRDSASWSDAVTWNASAIDPDLFFDDASGKTYLTSAGIVQQEIDLETGNVTEPVSIWNGTGGSSPEGPHLYRKDGWYYLMIAEGGTELGHSETIARSKNVSGPYEAYEGNPILTNRGTGEYFQTVGHADFFQDSQGNWWGMALATRSGPRWEVYPMGREAVLFPVTWDQGEWPVVEQVRGLMEGWPLPKRRMDIKMGPEVQDPDVYDFEPGTELPGNLVFWRYPDFDSFVVSPEEGPFSLKVLPSRANLTGVLGSEGNEDFALTGKMGISFIGRRQTHTLFKYGVDLVYDPQQPNQEAGVTVFLTQLNHMELGIGLQSSTSNSSALEFRFRVMTDGTTNKTSSVPPSYTHTTPIPSNWKGPIRLQIHTVNDTFYGFSAWPVSDPNKKMVLAEESVVVVSGGSGPFTGALVGVYATCDGVGGRSSTVCPGEGGEAYWRRWRYEGAAQEYDFGDYQFDFGEGA